MLDLPGSCIPYPDWQPRARNHTSGECNASHHIWLLQYSIGLSVLAFQIRIVLSKEPDTTCLPSWENATDQTISKWPSSVTPVDTFNIWTELAPEDTSRLPPEEEATQFTKPECQYMLYHPRACVPHMACVVPRHRYDSGSIRGECSREYSTPMTLMYAIYIFTTCIPPELSCHLSKMQSISHEERWQRTPPNQNAQKLGNVKFVILVFKYSICFCPVGLLIYSGSRWSIYPSCPCVI